MREHIGQWGTDQKKCWPGEEKRTNTEYSDKWPGHEVTETHQAHSQDKSGGRFLSENIQIGRLGKRPFDRTGLDQPEPEMIKNRHYTPPTVPSPVFQSAWRGEPAATAFPAALTKYFLPVLTTALVCSPPGVCSHEAAIYRLP